MTEDQFLKAVGRDLQISELQASNEILRTMVQDAMDVFDRYLNVPESVALRKRWESFKNQTL